MRARLIISFVLVVSVSIGSMALLFRQSAQREVGNFMFRGGMVGLDDMVNTLENHYSTNGSWSGVEAIFQTHGHGMGARNMPGMGMMNSRLRLADVNGLLLADTHNPQPSGRLTPQEIDNAIALTAGRATVGYLLPEGMAAFSIRDQANLLLRLNRAALTAGLLGAILSLLLAALLTYRLSRPIRDLQKGAERLAAGDLSQRVAVSGDHEMVTLGVTFNQMAASLQKAESNRRALTADIAHELRTPLAVQRAHLEALQDGIYPLTAENLEPILAQNHLLTHLVDDLRTLALAEAGQLTLDLTSVNLAGLVQRQVERFMPQAAASQVVLRYTPTAANMPSVQADPIRIEQIVSNLLTNALRHTPEGGQVTLALKQTPGEVQLEVSDSGPGIPAEALPHIFERFYRADLSRSRQEGGTGLGLSIARQLAQAHGGNLTAGNQHGSGAIFTLSLPLQTASHKMQPV